MFSYYKKVTISLVLMLLLTAILGIVAIELSFLKEPLLPLSDESSFHWRATPYTDAAEGGASSLQIIDKDYSFSLTMLLREQSKSPFAMGEIEFLDDSSQPATINLEAFTTLSFMAKCLPDNTLTFSLFTLEDNLSELDDARSDRISTRYFHCKNEWQRFDIDITQLETPEWWYKWYEQALSDQEYSLSHVVKIAFGSSIQSPTHVQSSINIRAITFSGKDTFYWYCFGVFCAVAWIALLIWLVRQHAIHLMRDVTDKIQKDRPLMTYQHMSIESHKEKETATLLKLMATEYANPALNLDYLVQASGINRNKINDILKDELGYTFSAYLNKLRLNEAARLLSANTDVNISEIAYTVGYKNVPYFNKLFKNEYGCSPKLFKGNDKNIQAET